MKKLAPRALLAIWLALPLALVPLTGCPATSATPVPLAPGYLSAADQAIGEGLAAVNAFVNQEKLNYAQLSTVAQATEKAPLNALVLATNLANSAYLAYHAAPTTANLTAAQNQLTSAQSAQAALAQAKGVQ